MEYVVIPEGLTKIGFCAFKNCTSLEWIQVSKSVIGSNTYLGQAGRWFEGCSNLREIILEEGMEKIPASMFSNLPAGVSVRIPDSVKLVEGGAFSGSGITALVSTGYEGEVEAGTIVLPEGVHTVGRLSENQPVAPPND